MLGHDPGAVFLMIFLTLLCIGLPVVILLLEHQRKMAQLLQNSGRKQGLPTVENQEIVELRQIVAQQAIAIDSLLASQRQHQTQVPRERSGDVSGPPTTLPLR